MLNWCDNCKENSVKVKVYTKDGKRKRVGYCINKGCGFKLSLNLKEEK